MMEQIMKLSQEFKLDTRKKDGLLVDEKNARLKVEETLQSCLERLEETENKLKRVETASMDNRKALGKYTQCAPDVFNLDQKFQRRNLNF